MNCNGKIKIDLTRQQIANMTGLRVETVIRTIRSLHDTGQLTIERGKGILLKMTLRIKTVPLSSFL